MDTILNSMMSGGGFNSKDRHSTSMHMNAGVTDMLFLGSAQPSDLEEPSFNPLMKNQMQTVGLRSRFTPNNTSQRKRQPNMKQVNSSNADSQMNEIQKTFAESTTDKNSHIMNNAMMNRTTGQGFSSLMNQKLRGTFTQMNPKLMSRNRVANNTAIPLSQKIRLGSQDSEQINLYKKKEIQRQQACLFSKPVTPSSTFRSQMGGVRGSQSANHS